MRWRNRAAFCVDEQSLAYGLHPRVPFTLVWAYSSATPGHDGGENTRPAPDGTTTRPASVQYPHDHPADNKPGLQYRR